MGCLGENTIVAFSEGLLGAAGVGAVEAHVAACPDCWRLVVAAVELRTHGHSGDTTAAAEAMLVLDQPRGPLPRGTAVGRYTLLGLAGRGGMGEVYAAYDAELDRKVAFKILNDRGPNQDARGPSRLLREARAMAKLSHPNVVAVHETGHFGERVFVAMEYVDGVTLRAWLKERPRGHQEILAAFTQAARGLAAAHAVGLVHRDFKPGNVMIARDGAVRVLDFGLARHVGDQPGPGETAEAAPAPALPADREATAPLTLTATGELLGTPRYMAPEQFRAAATDARTDQFSYCIALYEALYGEPPFGAGGPRELMPLVLSGRVRPVPAKSNVPAWLRRVLLRGLSVTPDARWPSMDALVAALRRDPASRRWRWALVLSAAAMVGISAITMARNGRSEAAMCRGGATHLVGVWEPPAPAMIPRARRDAIRNAVLTSGAPAAADIWERLEPLLDRYAMRWLEMYDDACRATHFRHEQTAAVLDLRMGCLDERRTALGALTEVFAHADRDVTQNAIDAANALPRLDRCGDIKALQTVVDPPRDDVTRRKVDDLHKRAAAAKALHDTGKYRDAFARVDRLIAEAEATGYRPLLAEMLTSRAEFQGAFSSGHDLAVTEQAVWIGLGSARDDLAARAAIALVGISYLGGQPAGGWWWSRVSRAILDRLPGSNDLLWGWLLHDEANLDVLESHPDRALERYRRSLDRKKKALDPDHPDIAVALNSIADMLVRTDRAVEALPINAEAIRLWTRAYGSAAFDVCIAKGNRGEYLVKLGRAEEALPILNGALACLVAQTGPDSRFDAYPLTALGQALLSLDHPRPAEAVHNLEQALRAREAQETDHLLVAETRFALAQALWEARDDRKRALALAEDARDVYARGGDTTHATTVEAWLDGRRRTPP